MIRRSVTLVVLLLGMGARATEIPVRYRLAAAGTVSVAVYDSQGTLVRELLRAVPQQPGEHVVTWDGRDREQRPVRSGQYGWKLLATQGLRAEYLLSVGSNYPIGTDRSSSGGPGTHLTPFAVTADPTGIYVAALQTENIESCALKMSADGKTRIWSQQLPSDNKAQFIAWEGARALRTEDGEIYLLGHRLPQHLHVSDAKTGVPRRAFTVDWEPPRPEQIGGEANGGGIDFALSRGIAFVTYADRDAVGWFNAKTGAFLGARRVRKPSAIAAARDGNLFAISDDRVVRMTADPRRAVVTVRRGLTRPGPLAIDPLTGDVLVFEAGTRQQVVRMSAGQLLRRYGKIGGRQDGLYVPGDFRDVTALATDASGGFFIAEPHAAPRRVAHFDKDGQLLQEWYGGQPWDTSVAVEPNRPEALWMPSAMGLDGSLYVMRVLVDYATRTWRVHSCYRYVSSDNRLMHDSRNEGRLLHVLRHGDTNYLAAESDPMIWRIDEATWRLVPATSTGPGFQWNDANGDGRVQEDEKSFYQGGVQRLYLVPHLAENFDFFFVSNGSEPCRIRRIPVTSWTAAGAPVYGSYPDGEVYAACPARFTDHGPNDARWSTLLHFDVSTRKLFAAFNPGTTGWCESRDSFVQAWDTAGRPKWQVGEQGRAPATHRLDKYTPTPPGSIYWNLRGIAGTVRGSFVAFDVDGGWSVERPQTYVWDPDGLFVGSLFDHPNLDRTPEFLYHLGGEFAHGTLFRTADGQVIFAGNWESEMRLYRITGWDEPAHPWTHATGRLTIP